MSAPRPVASALNRMPVLATLHRRLRETSPLATCRVGMVFHQTAEAAVLALVVRAAGAELRMVPSKVATADPAVVPELEAAGIEVETPSNEAQRQACLGRIADDEPQLLIDNADLFRLWHGDGGPQHPVLGSTVHSRSACALVERHCETRKPRHPVLAVGSTPAKLDLESRYGTGQSVIASLIGVTGMQLSGKRVTVVGYGNVGRGMATFLRGLKAHVTVVQSSPYRALEALLDGFEVRPLGEAVAASDVVLTATGSEAVLGRRELLLLRDGTVIANIGRNQEIDVEALEELADKVHGLDRNVTVYRLGDAEILLLGGGHQFNHVAGSANSSEIMDLSLSLHVLGLIHLRQQNSSAPPTVRPVPPSLVDEMARLKLDSLGIYASVSDPLTSAPPQPGRKSGGDHAVHSSN